MSTYYYGPALDAELAYRRDALRHAADAARLAREARRSRRMRRTGAGHPAIQVRQAPGIPAATVSGATPGPGRAQAPVATEVPTQLTGSAECPVCRAA